MQAAATRRLAEDRARRSLEQVEIREIDHPLDEFQRLVAETVAFKDMLASHVAALQGDYRYGSDRVGEQLRAEVALYERAMDRCGKFLGEWARLGLEERIVQLDEARFAIVQRGLEAYRHAAQVSPEEHRAGVKAMAATLRAGEIAA